MSSTTVPLEQFTSSIENISNKDVNETRGLPGSSHDGKGKHLYVEWVGLALSFSGCTIAFAPAHHL